MSNTTNYTVSRLVGLIVGQIPEVIPLPCAEKASNPTLYSWLWRNVFPPIDGAYMATGLSPSVFAGAKIQPSAPKGERKTECREEKDRPCSTVCGFVREHIIWVPCSGAGCRGGTIWTILANCQNVAEASANCTSVNKEKEPPLFHPSTGGKDCFEEHWRRKNCIA